MAPDMTIYPAWRQAVVDFQETGFSYGDPVPLSWLYKAMKVEQPGPKTPWNVASKANLEFGIQLGQFRAHLLENCLIDLQKDASSRDYIVVRPEDQGPRAYEEGLHNLKQEAKRVVRRMIFTASDLLTSEQQARDADLFAHFTHLRAVILKPRRKTMLELAGK
jgi:hypothetical protein